MRILIWGFTPPTPDSAYWLWLKTGMEAAGHQVIVVDGYVLAAVFGVRQMQDILLAYARAYRVQAALFLPQNFVETRFVDALRAQGTAVISFRYDDGMLCADDGGHAAYPRVLANFTYADAHCDLAVTISRAARDILIACGMPVPIYLPPPYGWQAIPVIEKPRRPVIAYAGSPKFHAGAPLSVRVAIIQALMAAGLPVEAHHDAWADVPGCRTIARPTPTLDGFFDIFRTSLVNLVIPSEGQPVCYPAPKGLNSEIAAAGGMQITYPCPELSDLFVIGEEVAIAETVDAYVEQARHYLDHPDEALRMGRASRAAMVRNGGWDRWWQGVAVALADKGIILDLTAPPVADEAAADPVLMMAATALAHLYEGQGKTTLATVYYEEMLRYRPDDYSALCGMARLRGPGPETRKLWARAAASIGETIRVKLDHGLPTPGIGQQGTHFAGEAAFQWARLALADGAFEEVPAALAQMYPYEPNVGLQTAQFFLDRQRPDLARQCLDTELTFWPHNDAARRLRMTLAQAGD